MQLDVKFNEAVICHLHLSITFYCKGHNDWILWLVTFSNISPKTWLVVINLITLPEAVVFPHCKHVEATLQCIIGAPETRAMAMRKLCVLAVVMASRGDDAIKNLSISPHFPHPMLYFQVLRPVKPG